jgi:ubiquinone biosynthesis protein UbiJ
MLAESLILALNALLAEQPGARAVLARHAGKPIRLRLPGAEIGLQASPDGRFEPADRDAEPRLSLTPDLGRLPLWLSGGRLADLFRIDGDAVLATDLGSALAGFDWVLALRPYFGDIVASRLDQFFRAASGWREQTLTAAGRNVADYALYEANLLVDAEAVRGFVAEIDHLREDLDRLEARLAILESRR